MTTAFISENEFRAACPEIDLSRYDSPTISGILVRATAKAENFLNYSLIVETKTEKLEAFCDPSLDIVIFPTKRPIRSVSGIQIVKAGTEIDLTISSGGQDYFDIEEDGRSIRLSGSRISLTSVSVLDFHSLRHQRFYVNLTYTAGYYPYDRPQDIVEAVILYAQDTFSRALNSSGAKKISQGSVSIEYSQRDGKSDFVQDAESLLSDYKRWSRW